MRSVSICLQAKWITCDIIIQACHWYENADISTFLYNICYIATDYVQVDKDPYSAGLGVEDPVVLDILVVWIQLMAMAVMTIWARGVGPRFRPDQLSDITWKDLLIFLVINLIILIIVLYI
jgi:NADH:ubiquinone oxidoreductase subunit H